VIRICTVLRDYGPLEPSFVGVKLRCRGFGKFDLRLAPAEGAEMDGLVPLLVTLKDRGERWIQMGIV